MILNDGIRGKIPRLKPESIVLWNKGPKKTCYSVTASDLTGASKVHRDRKGTLAVEYAVIAALIALPLVGSAPDYARKVQKTFAVVSRAFQTACEASAGTNACK